MNITENDKALIAKAKTMSCIFWGKIDLMQQFAESDEAKQELLDISRRKYHQEEYLSDNL